MAVGPFLSAPTMRSLFLLATIIRAIVTSIAASSDYARPGPCAHPCGCTSPPASTLAKPSRPWGHNSWFLSHNVKWCSKHIGPRHPSLRSCMIRFQRRFNILSCYTWPSVITCNVDCAYPWILKIIIMLLLRLPLLCACISLLLAWADRLKRYLHCSCWLWLIIKFRSGLLSRD